MNRVHNMTKNEAYSSSNSHFDSGGNGIGIGNYCPCCFKQPCECWKHNSPSVFNPLPTTSGQICPECSVYIVSQQEMYYHLKNHILLRKLQPKVNKPWPIVPSSDHKHLC